MVSPVLCSLDTGVQIFGVKKADSQTVKVHSWFSSYMPDEYLWYDIYTVNTEVVEVEVDPLFQH